MCMDKKNQEIPEYQEADRCRSSYVSVFKVGNMVHRLYFISLTKP